MNETVTSVPPNSHSPCRLPLRHRSRNAHRARKGELVSTTLAPSTPTKKRDRTHYLYLAVIVAVVAGIAVGLLAPDFAVKLKPLGTGFVSLIKMLISPVIFCTIVLGVGSIRKAAKVGKVGGLAL